MQTIDAFCHRLASYLPHAQVQQVRRAYYYSEQAHDGQTRRSGEPYVTHPLAVAGILVMNVMLVSVTQRTSEIGLLKALGATGSNIRLLFLTEACMLSLAGALVGFGLGQMGAAVIRQLYPTFPAYPPDWAVLAGLGTALVTGILFGVLPPRRAAQLAPVQALSKR